MLPNFLIIGAHKAGTTSLYQYCREHPEIYMSPLKETNFLAYSESQCQESRVRYPIRSLQEYQQLFTLAGNAKAIGEASPAYLHSDNSLRNIKRYVSQAKLIVSLRNPVDRAYSGYMMAVRDGRISLSTKFNDQNSFWIQNSFYYDSLRRFLRMFSADKIKIILFDRLKRDTLDVMREVFTFLEVDDAFAPDVSYQHNPGGIPENELYHRLYHVLRRSSLAHRIVPKMIRRTAVRLRDRNLKKPPRLERSDYSDVLAVFREDIFALQDLIQIDLSMWLVEPGLDDGLSNSMPTRKCLG